MADATVPKWKLLQNKKQSLYSNSTEKAQKVSRRNRGSGRYEPKGDDVGGSDAWKGQAFGLASSRAAAPRFDPKLRRGELYYGQKRPLSTDVCPDEPVANFLDRCPRDAKKAKVAPLAAAAAKKAKKAKKKKAVVLSSSSSSSSSSSDSSDSSDSDSDSDSDSSSSSSSSGSSSSSSSSSSSDSS